MERFLPVLDARPEDKAWPALLWPPRTGVRLTGKAVELTRCEPVKDCEPLFFALNDDEVWRHVAGRPRDPEDFAAILEAYAAAGRFIWTMRLVRALRGLRAGTVVGTTSYLDPSPPDARLEIGGTTYTRAVWGSEVNPETKRMLLAYAFDELGAGRVQLKTDVRNVRSQQAIARLGARYEGTFRRHQRRDDGTIRDTVFFSVVAEDWPVVREGLAARLELAELGGPA